jgi:hypothetical protein
LVAAAAALLVTAVVGLSAGILVVEKEQKRTAEQRAKFKEASEQAIHNLAKSHIETAALELERKHPAVAMSMLWQAYSESPADELIVSGARRLLGGCNLGIPFLFSDVGTPAFSPDGQTILTGGYQNGVRLWDASTGKLLHELWDRP